MTKEVKIEKDLSRPWGGFVKFIENKPCTVKILQIKKGESLSLQSHKLREEFWYLISGKIKVTISRNLKSIKKKVLKEGQFISVPKNFLHRIKAIENSKILEISIGKFKENDEIRYEDKYGRKSPKK